MCISGREHRIGEEAIIGPNSRLVNSKIGNGTEVNNSVVLDSP
jgi:bifunctional UDP-N-acetylglucosamine pyrophosphorylase/glucosamine-1-phosphate N-acetyltransferase